MLTDDDLTRLLEEAGESYPVPEPSVEAPEVPTPVWRRHRPQVTAAAAAAVLVVGALVLSNTGGLGSTASDSNGLTSVAGSTHRSGAANGTAGTTGSTTGGGAGLSGPVPGVLAPLSAADRTAQRAVSGTAGTVPPVGAPASGGAGTSSVTPDDVDAARIVKTGTLSLVVDDGRVKATVDRVLVLVAGVSGYSSNSTSDLAGDHPSASLTVRVPVNAFDGFLTQVQRLKVKVVSATQTGKDVTASYADTQAQIQSLRSARSRFLTILSRARTISEILTVQQRVDDVQQQIDRLEGRRRVLAAQSDYGTVTISVGEKDDAEAFITKEPSGWGKAWDDAKHGFSSGVQSLIAHSGSTLLVLIVGAALLLLGRSGWRLARRRLV
ncbi:MAG: DUF4349 domain-containing protein [Actinomycetota bacterium]|nr:DUF4349 domain-containing protein [Actinomycetota bacterium]